MFRVYKDPDAVLDYGFDWSDWMVNNDSITASTWAAETGITIDSEDEDGNNNTATVWLSSGTSGRQYRVTNTITTQGGRVDERTLVVIVQNK